MKPYTSWQEAPWNTILPILRLMEASGGGFASHLAQAWMAADSQNNAILRSSFGHLLDHYALLQRRKALHYVPNWCRGGVGQPNQGGARWNNKSTCPTCGKRVSVTKSGRLHAHVYPKEQA